MVRRAILFTAGLALVGAHSEDDIHFQPPAYMHHVTGINLKLAKYGRIRPDIHPHGIFIRAPLESEYDESLFLDLGIHYSSKTQPGRHAWYRTVAKDLTTVTLQDFKDRTRRQLDLESGELLMAEWLEHEEKWSDWQHDEGEGGHFLKIVGSHGYEERGPENHAPQAVWQDGVNADNAGYLEYGHRPGSRLQQSPTDSPDALIPSLREEPYVTPSPPPVFDPHAASTTGLFKQHWHNSTLTWLEVTKLSMGVRSHMLTWQEIYRDPARLCLRRTTAAMDTIAVCDVFSGKVYKGYRAPNSNRWLFQVQGDILNMVKGRTSDERAKVDEELRDIERWIQTRVAVHGGLQEGRRAPF